MGFVKFHKVFFPVFAVILVLALSNNGPIHQVNAKKAKVLKTNNASDVFTPVHSPGSSNKRLYNDYQMFLRIYNDKINGTSTTSDPYVAVQIEYSMVGRLKFGRIKGIRSGKYLAMNRNGDLYPSTDANNDEGIFRITNPTYQYISSHKYYKNNLYDAFVGIRRNGKAMNGRKTKKNRSTKFLII